MTEKNVNCLIILDMLIYVQLKGDCLIKLWHAAIYISHPPDVRRVNENGVCSDQQGIRKKNTYVHWLSIWTEEKLTQWKDWLLFSLK